MAGAFTLEALFTLLNFADVPSTWRATIQGVIVIAAVAYSAVAFRSRRKTRATQASPEKGKVSDLKSPAQKATPKLTDGG
jgi:ribose transport system permease protein